MRERHRTDCILYENCGWFLFILVLQLDSATSLIQAAKNLMNAVVLTVKYSYVASTKYTRQGVVAVSDFFFLFVYAKLLNNVTGRVLIYCLCVYKAVR